MSFELRGFKITNRGTNRFHVVGEVPLEVARALYTLGRQDILVACHGGNVAPEPPFVDFYGPDDEQVIHDPSGQEEAQWDAVAGEGGALRDVPRPRFVRNVFLEPNVEGFVTSYHVNSEMGLHLLVEAVREYRRKNKKQSVTQPRMQYRTTFGKLSWDDPGRSVTGVDNPDPPDGEGWELCGTAIGEMRNSMQPLIWTWRRSV